MKKRLWIIMIITMACALVSGCTGNTGNTYSVSDAKRIAEDKLGFTYTELNPDDYFHERRLGDQSGIVIKGHEQGAPFDEMYFLPCASGEDAIRLYNRSIEDMSRTWDETEDSFWGMYYVSDAGIYVYVCRKENMVIEITRTSSDGGGPWSEEEYERYNAMEKHNKEAFEEFIHSDFQIVW